MTAVLTPPARRPARALPPPLPAVPRVPSRSRRSTLYCLLALGLGVGGFRGLHSRGLVHVVLGPLCHRRCAGAGRRRPVPCFLATRTWPRGGFSWFPGPVVLELPFMLLASPLDHAALAGPLSTATCGRAHGPGPRPPLPVPRPERAGSGGIDTDILPQPGGYLLLRQRYERGLRFTWPPLCSSSG